MACSSGAGGGGGAGAAAGAGNGSNGGGGGSGNAGGGGNGGGGGNTCVACGDGCPSIPCECADDSIVNASFCDNGCCASQAATCTDACKDAGGWVGGGGNGGGGGNSGGGGSGNAGGGGSGGGGNDVGGECKSDDGCKTQVCLFKGSATFGYCSKMCESFADCPSFWECEEVGNASGKYCVQK
ncbi:MAG: hypothetical protein HYZ29_31730 [Myxococcales bacterium]|nr:hypothetical protein [Myxococcales bacterium]